jgi:hypothetical protein
VRNGRFDTPKYRSKVKKQGCCTLILQRSPGPCNMQGPSKNKIKWFPKKKFKKSHALSLQAVARSRWATVGHRLLRATVVLPATAGQSTVARSRVTSGCRSLVGAWSTACDCACVGPPIIAPFLLPPTLSPYLPPKFFAHVVKCSSLAPSHARPAQTSPKNFKHP